ncbi:MAG: prolyl-tRNA synthetase associated domain-containing protein [Rubritepida sp.]|jgi:Ala-tRNA(Pro) deacylase|nr:prolyl-tRNA synthetase associated domain-containing protein [Rubritepida sp.]
METPEGLLARLAAAGIAARTEHHAPVFTVAESQALRGSLPGAHSKNLFLRAAKGEGFFLAVLEESRQVSVNALARAAGWPRVSMASAEELRATLGVEPGSVTPFGLVNAAPGAVQVVLDAALARAEGLVWFHPLVNRMSTGLAPAALLRFLDGCGHAVRVLELDSG